MINDKMEEIYNKIVRVYKNQQYTHFAVTFYVPQSFDKLIFETSYSPKYQDDFNTCMSIIKTTFASEGSYLNLSEKEMSTNFPLKNHISWSFDSPSKYLGTKHLSWKSQTHFISKNEASFGLTPSTIDVGVWTITASLNCIVTDWIDIALVVKGEIYVE